MKRKRNQVEETSSLSNNNNNEGKKFRFATDENESDRNDSIDENTSLEKEEFVLTREIAENAVLTDIAGNNWRIGAPIGKGSFGEIFLASNDVDRSVSIKTAHYVTKIEPHSNGPLFVEIHCLLNVNKSAQESNEFDVDNDQEATEIVGIPKYIASGSHYFSESRYRFLIMPRYKTDLHSIMKHGRLSSKHFLIVASQIIDVLMHLHSKHYVHSDIKAENIMIGLCKNLTKANDNFQNGKGLKSVQFGGANPLRNCRVKNPSRSQDLYNDMIRSHYLRPSRSVTYATDERSRGSKTPDSDHSSNESDQDEDFELTPRKRKARRALNRARAKRNASKPKQSAKSLFPPSFEDGPVENEDSDSESGDRVYVIDYGLATKFIDTNGQHRPFCMDQRRAHDGTIEFTSRDAHFGAHSRRSDLECLGYNLMYWSQGFLPWKDDKLKEQPEIVHRLKEVFMTDVKEMMKLLYGKDYPRFLGEFMHYVGQLEFDEEPNYAYLKGLLEKEFVKLGLDKTEMKLSLSEIREQCEPNDKTQSENDLMVAAITDLKTARKLGFLIVTDSVDGNEFQTKTIESIGLNISCKASPKNLRSKEKTMGKRQKRQPKLTEKELISEKMAKGKKLSMAEIATLDPDQIARERADREYEKFDEREYYQTPRRYTGKPTYAILEIETKLRNKLNGSAAIVSNGDIEPIKGYTKPMMDVLKKQQMLYEQQITPVVAKLMKRSREGLRNVIKPTKKNLSNKIAAMNKKPRKQTLKERRKSIKTVEFAQIEEEIADENEVPEIHEEDIELKEEPVPEPPRRKRGRPKGTKLKQKPELVFVPPVCDDSTNDVAEIAPPVKRGRGRPKMIRTVIEPPETEEDSVYYDIPGEGSNDGVKEISEDENEPEIVSKKSRRVTPNDDNSNQGSVASGSASETLAKGKNIRGRYYTDDDYDVSVDDTTNISSVSNATKSSTSLKPGRGRPTSFQEEGIATRNKVKSRSTSRSAAAFTEASDQSECSEGVDNDSEYQMQSGDESGEENEEQEQEQGIDYERSETDEEEEDEDDGSSQSEMADSNESNDSIDIKYSPIKTRHARRRIPHYSLKQIRGRRMEVSMNEDARNFRLVSTQG